MKIPRLFVLHAIPLALAISCHCYGDNHQPAPPEQDSIHPVHATPFHNTAMRTSSDPVLEFPESVTWDAKNQFWYVSNIGGKAFVTEAGPAPTLKDGNGFISRLHANGDMETLAWITGLDAPKALAAHNDTLYVADLQTLVIADTKSASITKRIVEQDAGFLNGLAIDNATGDVYISDFPNNRIYRYKPGTDHLELFLESAELTMPNGLHVDNNVLIVGSWGNVTDPATYATAIKGQIRLVNLQTRAITSVGTEPLANIDGIVKAGDHYIISDWLAGELIQVSGDGTPVLLGFGYDGCADIGFDPHRSIIAIPEMSPKGNGRVTFFQLSKQ